MDIGFVRAAKDGSLIVAPPEVLYKCPMEFAEGYLS
jgi:hypothetical protein